MLTDGVITLRPPEPGDVDALYEACQDPDIQRWTSVPSPYTRQDALGYVALAPHEAGTKHLLAFDDTLLGSFSLLELDKAPGYGEIGYWVAKPARGRGVATRAVILLRDWAAANLGLTLIELLIHVDNAMSLRVAERTGFLDTGERRPAPRQTADPARNYAVYAWRPV